MLLIARSQTRWLVCLSLFWLANCRHQPPVEPPMSSVTYRPVYMSRAEFTTIALMAPQPLKNPGKIYIKDHYLLVGESGNGFHIVDNTDPAKPRKLAFVSIPGNTDFAIKDNTLYANNGADLLTYNITDLNNIRLMKRLENVLPAQNDFPDARNVRFECADPSRGYVIRWEAAPVQDPKCFR
ncbi:MAG TPA: hypothetical protein VGA96_13185 [Fibrella sp.]